MHFEWWGSLIFLGWTIFVAGAVWWLGRILHGELLVWHLHPRIKRGIERGYKFWVLRLAPSRLSPGLTDQRVALLQDEFGLDNPFGVFFPPESECKVVEMQLVVPKLKDGKYILCPVPFKQPAMAC